MIKNPQFRPVKKAQWIDQSKPFRVVKVDNRNHYKTEEKMSKPEPFTDLGAALTQSKRVDDFLLTPQKIKDEDWSPDAVSRREKAAKAKKAAAAAVN